MKYVFTMIVSAVLAWAAFACKVRIDETSLLAENLGSRAKIICETSRDVVESYPFQVAVNDLNSLLSDYKAIKHISAPALDPSSKSVCVSILFD